MTVTAPCARYYAVFSRNYTAASAQQVGYSAAHPRSEHASELYDRAALEPEFPFPESADRFGGRLRQGQVGSWAGCRVTPCIELHLRVPARSRRCGNI